MTKKINRTHTTNICSKPMFSIPHGLKISRESMQSLAGEAIVAKDVIDGWVHVLNDEENYRSPNSPRRVFFTSDIGVSNNLF